MSNHNHPNLRFTAALRARSNSTLLRALAVVATLVTAAASVNAQNYTVTEVGTLDGKNESFGTAINNNGEVAGTTNAGPGTEAAFRFHAKTGIEPVDYTSKTGVSRAFGINDSGAVVGDSTFGADSTTKAVPVNRAALFANGTVRDLGTLPKIGAFSRANDINASGFVVGFAGPTLDSQNSRAFIWTTNSGMTDLGTLGGTYAQATAINNSSFIVGHSQTRPTRAGGGETHAFIYQYLSTFSDGPTAAMTDLGTLGGGYSYATDVNDSNQVVGYSTIDAEGHFHAFLHDGKAMQDLGSLGTPGNKTDQSFGLGVNKSGEVVGYSFLPSADQVAFVFRGGKMWDLNTLIGSAVKEYYLYSAEGINDQGQIIATAFVPASNTFRAVILTPESVVNTK